MSDAREILASIDVEFSHNGEVYAFDLGSDNAAVALAALSAAGFVIVPREPTEEMRVAGCKNVASWWTAGRDTMPYGHEPNFIWSAMLSAAEGKK